MKWQESWSTKIAGISNRVENFWERYFEVIQEWTGLVGGPFILYAALRLGLTKAAEVNQILGLGLSVAFLVLLIWIVWSFWRHRESNYKKYSSHSEFFFLLAAIILMATAVLSSFSFILYELDAVGYTSDNIVTPGRLSDFYLWHLVDSFPFFAIWSTFNVSEPLETDGNLAAFLVFLFRIAFIIPTGILIREWWNSRKKKTQPSPV